MVRNRLDARRRAGVRAVLLVRQVGHRLHNGPERVRLEVGIGVLDDAGHALEAEACIDILARERLQRTVRLAVELREHEVPVLEEAVALATHVLQLVPGVTNAAVDVQFAARPARAHRPHRPEVVVRAHGNDAVAWDPDLLPHIGRLKVLLIDGHPDAVGGQAQDPRRELVGPGDGVVLEVVADGEVAQHLEEGVMPRGATDPLDVIGADALLVGGHAHPRGDCLAQVVLLERHHARGGKQQGGVRRQQGSAGKSQMVVPLEKLEESFSNIG